MRHLRKESSLDTEAQRYWGGVPGPRYYAVIPAERSESRDPELEIVG